METANVRTENDWMVAVAWAAENNNMDMLEDLDRMAQGWVQDEETRQAQQAVMHMALNLAEMVA